jgi:uncharacterized protein (DUF433 family)
MPIANLASHLDRSNTRSLHTASLSIHQPSPHVIPRDRRIRARDVFRPTAVQNRRVGNGRVVPAARYTGVVMSSEALVVHSDPEILSGTPVFVGTRVPVQSLFDYIEGGDTLDEFLRQFPSVRREQAIAALELARESLMTRARTA